MSDLETIFAKLIEVINGAHGDFPDGNFFVVAPNEEWCAMELSLNRSLVSRTLAPSHFVWRGEYVTRGETWSVWPVGHK